MQSGCRDLEADAHVDKDIKRVLDGCDGDPDKVEAKIDEYLASDGYNPNNDIYPRLGRDEITRVVFRAYNPSNIWVCSAPCRSTHGSLASWKSAMLRCAAGRTARLR